MKKMPIRFHVRFFIKALDNDLGYLKLRNNKDMRGKQMRTRSCNFRVSV
jgi:hypothetical protein